MKCPKCGLPMMQGREPDDWDYWVCLTPECGHEEKVEVEKR